MKRRSRLFWIAFSLCVLVLLVQTGEWIIVRHVRADWAHVCQERIQATYSSVQKAFDAYQQDALHVAKDVASSPALLQEISGKPKPDQRVLFSILQGHELEPEASVEIYDTSGVLLAWWGRTAGLQHKQVDVERETSFVSSGTVYSYLTVVVPMPPGCGFAVVHRVFDVNYPFSNRFISSADFTHTFPHRLNLSASYDFSHQPSRNSGEKVISVPLYGITGAPIGYTYIGRPDLSSFLDEIRNVARKVRSVLLAVLSLILFFVVGKAVHGSGRAALPVAGVVILMWVVRTTWLAIGFPSDLFTGGIFDPRYFASPFGFGIAKSLGELLITSIILCAGVLYVVYLLFLRFFDPETAAKGSGPSRKLLRLLSIPILVFMVFLFHRGLTATIRSAVFDSSLVYNEPTAILPNPELAVALVILFLITVAFVAASVIIIGTIYRGHISLFGSSALNVLILFVTLGTGSVVFGALYPNPLVGQVPRLVILAALFSFVLYLAGLRETREVFRVRTAAVGVALAIAILVFQLDDQVHQRERKNIELLASELGKPVDAWLSFVVEQALREMSGEEAARVLTSDETEELQRLAFTQWARSILSREGYNCSVMFLDAEGHLVSTFRIGAQRLDPFSPSLQELYLDSYARTPITVSEQRGILGKRKIYSGSTIITDKNGTSVGSLAVIISAGEQTLFRGEATPILRSYDREEEQYVRKLVISEFVDGNLVNTTGDDLQMGERLPQAVAAALEKQAVPAGRQGSVWVDERAGPEEFETLYFRMEKGGKTNSTLALRRNKADWRWHVFDYLRPVLFYALVLLAGAIIFVILLSLRGHSFRMSFRGKLLMAFFIVSLVPVVIIAYYDREIAIERANQSILERLSAETSSLRTRIARESGGDYTSGAEFVRSLTDDWCENVATEVGTDFSIYLDQEEKASSRPELFEAEILNRRLSGETFRQVVLGGRSFYVENQVIGNYTYLVGYRPLLLSSGGVPGVLAVPILYKQLEIAEELAQRNALLFGAYALVLVLTAAVGTIFANQISSPIRQLIAATRRIARGELNFQLPVRRADEIGELHQAFNKMTSDLKEDREALVKAERELAWKEMAKQVAHEIKNPLTPMKLSIQHLRQAFHDNDKNFRKLLEQVTDTIVGQIETLTRIASQFARYARMPERKEESFDLREVLADSAKLFQEYRGVAIHIHMPAEALILRADREEVQRAFINIIRNAVQAMNERGTITIAGGRDAAKVEIRISDTGSGIPEEIRHRLFEPNFSTKSEGMGLGLALVKKTVDDLQGTINIQSAPGKGTTVTILFPETQPIPE